MVFLGLISLFSAVYNLGFTKSSASTYLVLQQFIVDHGIPELIITDEDQSEVQSNQWKAVCAKFIIRTRNSEPHCQNQILWSVLCKLLLLLYLVLGKKQV